MRILRSIRQSAGNGLADLAAATFGYRQRRACEYAEGLLVAASVVGICLGFANALCAPRLPEQLRGLTWSMAGQLVFVAWLWRHRRRRSRARAAWQDATDAYVRCRCRVQARIRAGQWDPADAWKASDDRGTLGVELRRAAGQLELWLVLHAESLPIDEQAKHARSVRELGREAERLVEDMQLPR